MNYLKLINKEHIFLEKYLQDTLLIEAKDIFNNKILVEEKTYEAYLKLKEYLNTKNILIGITSSFRTIKEQEEIKKEILDEEGLEYTSKFVAEPGYSEHHTGLALDIGVFVDNEYKDSLDETTEHIFQKIHKELYKFGFILRYPKDKEKITGYNYEAWHIRYVGEIVSKIIYENNLTLEEYLTSFATVLYINKPKGITSFDVVKKIRNIFGIKKVGHTGTLDPLATGVMIITIGQATKIVELLTAYDKEYISTVKLGIKTDTLDITGTVLKEEEVKNINIDLKLFQKTYLQEVPIYSAVKVDGKKLYEYARNKKEVILPKKEVTIKRIELLKKDDKSFTFKTLVSKGCYIRSLIRDISKEKNILMTMSDLIRTKQGKITLEECNSIEDIINNNYINHSIIDVLDYPVVRVNKEIELKIKNGVKVENIFNIKDRVIFINENNKILGIYEVLGNELKTWKNFI